MHIKSVRVVRGFAGWWLLKLFARSESTKYRGPYTSPKRAAAAARKIGWTVQAIEWN